MPVRAPNWYSLQSTRRYPLDDRATGTGDSGERLKDDILVDCHLQFPSTYGQYAYVGGITVTDRLVTLVLLGTTAPDATSDFTPLASVTLLQPINRHVHYPVTPLQPGVGGFVVFGDVAENFSARFSSPAQSLVLPKCARPYTPLPIPTLRKLGHAEGLTDVVKLLGGSDVEIVAERHEINGLEREALVLRLKQSVAGRNVLDVYRGPCDNRPESRTCDKEGIESINGVTPDCAGNIDILFVGLTDAPYDGCNSLAAGVTLDQEIGITAVCTAHAPGRFQGTDDCAPSESSSLSSSEGETPPPDDSDSSASSQSAGSVSSEACDELPVTVTFDTTDAPGFSIVEGDFVFEVFDSPGEPAGGDDVCYTADDTSRRNVSVLTHCDITSTVSKRVTTHVALVDSPSQLNGGLVLNYHLVDPLLNPHYEYFLVSLDRLQGKVRLLRWAGAGFIEEHAVVVTSPFVLEDWYSVVAEISTAGSNVALDISVTGITDPGWATVAFSILSNAYLPADGRFGVGSDRARARFSFFIVEEL